MRLGAHVGLWNCLLRTPCSSVSATSKLNEPYDRIIESHPANATDMTGCAVEPQDRRIVYNTTLHDKTIVSANVEQSMRQNLSDRGRYDQPPEPPA